MINKDYLTKWLGENATKKHQRLLFENNMVYATNTNVLFIIRDTYDKSLEGCVVGLDGTAYKDEKFPDYEKLFRIIKHDQYKKVGVDYDLMKKLLEKPGEFAYVKIGNIDYEFKKSTVFRCIVDFMEHTGSHTIYVSEDNRMVYIEHLGEYGFFMPFQFFNVNEKFEYETLDLKYEQHKLF